jgi:Uncharacterised protein family (UPF0236)
VTAAGRVQVKRRYHACRRCGATYFPFDDWAGLGKGRLSVGARRMACLAAMGWSFDQASKNLLELTGLDVSDQTIRRVAEAEGVRAHDWVESSQLAVNAVQAAPGNAEFLTDGTIVNTREGWQEVRLSVASKRAAGEPSDPAEFTGLAGRDLPKPAARVVLVSKLGCDGMGELWDRLSTRLGWGRGEGLSVISDGAKWIGSRAEDVWPKAERVIDVFHVSQHLHECAQVLHGEKTPEAREWAAQRLVELVRQGPAVLLWKLEQEVQAQKHRGKRQALESLLGYLRPNQHALRYTDRLRRGLPIGSGQIEGACKTVVGRRLKLNSARWSPQNVEAIGSLCGLQYSDLWDTYWSARAA